MIDGHPEHDRNGRRARDVDAMWSDLRHVDPCPDLTDRILDRVDRERPFSSRRTRSKVSAGRVGVLLALAGAVIGIVHIRNAAPEATAWAGRPAPLTVVVETASAGATQGFRALRTTLDAFAVVPAADVVLLDEREPGAPASMPGAMVVAGPAPLGVLPQGELPMDASSPALASRSAGERAYSLTLRSDLAPLRGRLDAPRFAGRAGALETVGRTLSGPAPFDAGRGGGIR